MHPGSRITAREYRALAEFRYQLRRFLHFSEESARSFGIEPAQHQCLLATMALSADGGPTIGDLAGRLLLRHHSVVGLVDRLEERGLVERARGNSDRRQVRVRITGAGEDVLRKLSVHHRDELRSTGPALVQALGDLLRDRDYLSEGNHESESQSGP
jgi:DNA-binding MarR family transcriptional regulator